MTGKTVFVKARFVCSIQRICKSVCMLVVIIYAIVNNVCMAINTGVTVK